MVPTVHANFRCLHKGDAMWFGGGADLTPYYPWREDVEHFHRTFKKACDLHDSAYYPRFKKWCDEYFLIKHRGETRGVGGVFFDNLGAKGEHPIESIFDFVREIASSFVSAYVPIAQRRMGLPFGETERTWQLRRRGRYVEFNLIYDRGTLFGLKTNGRIESILMSLPPIVRWDYDVMPQPGSPEAELTSHLRPIDWLPRR